MLFVGVVIKVSLNEDDGRTLVARAGGQIAERADQIGQTAGRRALGRHLADQVAVLLLDLAFDRLTKRLAREGSELVVCQVLELELVGRTLKTYRVGRGDDGIGKLPDFADGVLEGAVAVYHNLDALARCGEELLLDRVYDCLTVAGEELDLVLRPCWSREDRSRR